MLVLVHHRWQMTVIQVVPAVALLLFFFFLFLTACFFCYRRRKSSSPSLLLHHGYQNAGSVGSSSSIIATIVDEQSRHHSSAKSGWHLFFSTKKKKKDPFECAAPGLKHSSRAATLWRASYPMKAFDWSENPALVAEAVEHGWAAFAFTYTTIMPSASSLVSCNNNAASHLHHRISHRHLMWSNVSCTSSTCCRNPLDQLHEPEISWEMGHASQHLQKLWLNPTLPLPSRKENVFTYVQALQSVLPLPGPPIAARFFPQEGYFEITILAEGCEHNADMSRSSLAENEHAKLISKKPLSEKFDVAMPDHYHHHMNPDVIRDGRLRLGQQRENLPSALPADDGTSHFAIEKTSSPSKDNVMDGLQIAALGLAAGGAPPFRLPGHDAGSVGFHSNGRIYLNGVLHVEQGSKFPAIKRTWGSVKSTVGCGFNPLSRKVFFTVDGEKVYELTADNNEFGKPLYPTVASNYDVTLLVNFGQIAFEYALANTQRVSIPYLHRPFSRSMRNGSMNEDSGDLFSMGRIDSQWLSEVGSPDGDEMHHRQVLSEAESDLFEIVLESSS